MNVKLRKVPPCEGQLSSCGLKRQPCVHAANTCSVNAPQYPDDSFSSLTRNSSGPSEHECNNRGESELDSSSSSSWGPDATLLSSLPGSRPKREKGEPPQGMEEKYSRSHRPRQPALGKRRCSRHRCRCSRPWGCRTSGGCGDVRNGCRNNSRRSSRWGPWYLNWSVRPPGRLADARWIVMLFGLILLALPDSAHSYYLEHKVGNQTVCGSVRLINNFDYVRDYENCTIIDGSIYIGMTKVAPTSDQVFSKLTEITGYLSAYRNFELTSFKSLFPNLRVIRGRETMHNFALVIYQNWKMEDISLNSLTSVMRGAVRVNQNAVMCYVDTVNWPGIVKKSFLPKSVWGHNRKPIDCLTGCYGCTHCWNDQRCQTDPCRTLRCPSGVFCNADDPEAAFCCHPECEGGCYAENDETQCVACKNYRQRDACVPECQENGATYYRLREWLCVTRNECLAMNIGTTDDMTYTTADERQDGDVIHSCVLACPKNQEKGPGGSCLPCNGTCEKPACVVHDAVTNLRTMEELKDCTEINGDLVIQLDLSEHDLAKYLGKIRVIQGQLRVTNTHNLTSLSFLESLEEIRGDSQRGQGSGVAEGMTHSSQRVEYVIQLIHNKQLKKLFDWDRHRTIKVPRDKRILAMFNRKLCLRELEEAVKQFNFSVSFEKMKIEGDISPSSNGDLAICTTQRLGVRLAVTAANTAIWWLEWDRKSGGDYRKLIALLAYYRPIKEDENATYFDSNWQVRELWGGGDGGSRIWGQTEDRPDVCLLQHLQPYTYYAMYISSLSVGTDEVISDIQYFWTKPHKPGPVHGLEVVPRIHPDGRYYFNVRWFPPEKPNGLITHYKVRMRRMQGSFKRLRNMDFCTHNLPTSQVQYDEEPAPNVPVILQNATAEQCLVSCRCEKETLKSREEKRAYQVKEADIQMEIDFENMLQNNLFVKRPDDNDTDTANETTTTITTTTGMTTQASVAIGNIPGQKPPYDTVPTDGGGKGGLNPSEPEKEEELKLCPCPYEPTTPEPSRFNATTANSTGYNVTTATFTGVNVTTANVTGFNNVTTASPKLCPCPKPILCPCRENVTTNGTVKEVSSMCPCPGGPVDEDPLVFNQTFWARNITDGIELDFIPIGLESNLSYFTDYLIEVVACNVNYTKSCSLPMAHGARTEANASADTVDSRTITLKSVVNSTNAILVKWAEPRQPNGAILKYEVVLSLVGNPQKEQTKCVPINVYKKFGGGFELSETPGRYNLKIGAFSMNYVGDNMKYSDPVVMEVADPRNRSDSKKTDLPVWAAVLIALTVVGALLGVGLGYVTFRKLSKRDAPLEPIYTSANVNYPTTDFYNAYKADQWELEREHIQILNELGQGGFGKVFDGILKEADRETDVAVKTLKTNATYRDRLDFLNEASVMKEFTDCYHVVKLLGVVSEGSPVFVVMELMNQGDLKNYLRRRRPDEPDTVGPPPKPDEIYRMAAQITDGMAYLGDKKFVHRDLAARNCMVGEGNIVKIGDFGMTRDVYLNDYYRKDDKGMLPVRWMAPESLKDGVFTSHSDVWSFGVVLWEMVTLAAQPYMGMGNDQVLTFVFKGGTITMPEECPQLLYDLMSQCFKYWPKNRPNFADILKDFMPYVTEDFRAVAYLCSELRENYVAQQAVHTSASHTPTSQGPLSQSEGDKRDNVLSAEAHDGSPAHVEIELESFEPVNGTASSANYWKTKTPDSPNNGKKKPQQHSNSNGSAGSWLPPRQRSVKGGRGSRVHNQSCSRAGHNSADSDEPCECEPMTPSSGGGDSKGSKGSERSGKNGFANGSIPTPMDGLASG